MSISKANPIPCIFWAADSRRWRASRSSAVGVEGGSGSPDIVGVVAGPAVGGGVGSGVSPGLGVQVGVGTVVGTAVVESWIRGRSEGRPVASEASVGVASGVGTLVPTLGVITCGAVPGPESSPQARGRASKAKRHQGRNRNLTIESSIRKILLKCRTPGKEIHTSQRDERTGPQRHIAPQCSTNSFVKIGDILSL